MSQRRNSSCKKWINFAKRSAYQQRQRRAPSHKRPCISESPSWRRSVHHPALRTHNSIKILPLYVPDPLSSLKKIPFSRFFLSRKLQFDGKNYRTAWMNEVFFLIIRNQDTSKRSQNKTDRRNSDRSGQAPQAGLEPATL